MKAFLPESEVRLHPVKFDPDLSDIDVEHNGWWITLSFDKQGESVRLVLDGYRIDSIPASEAPGFIAALSQGRAAVRVAKTLMFLRLVTLDVEVAPARHISETRNWVKGLSDW